MIWLWLILPLAAFVGLFLRWRIMRRRDFRSLRWPAKLDRTSFQALCMKYLDWRGCVITEPTRPTPILKMNGMVVFASFDTRLPFPFEIDNLRYQVNRFRMKHRNGCGVIVTQSEVDLACAEKCCGTFVRVINFRELEDIDRFFTVAETPVHAPPAHATQEPDAWNILRSPSDGA